MGYGFDKKFWVLEGAEAQPCLLLLWDDKVLQDMKGTNKHLANNENGDNWVVKYPLAPKFCAELSGILNDKPEFEVPYNYHEVVHEDPL